MVCRMQSRRDIRGNWLLGKNSTYLKEEDLSLLRALFQTFRSILSFFPIPNKVRIRLEKIQRDFLWGDTTERRKIHLVNYLDICKDGKHGRFGIRRLEGPNQVLLNKWLWRFRLERESFWRKVILGKFGEVVGSWTTREVKDSYGISLWKNIRKVLEKFILRTNVRIGNGRHTRFWWDSWDGEFKLKDIYRTLFRLASHKNAIDANLWERKEGGCGH